MSHTNSAANCKSSPKSWRDVLRIHPAANRIPHATEEEKQTLATDLRDGQRVPVTSVRVATRPDAPPQLLHGRTRLDLQEVAGVAVIDADGKLLVPHEVKQVADDDEAKRFSLSLNVHRRHLTAEQKRGLIAELLKAQPEKSDRAIAADLKVDKNVVSRVRQKEVATGALAPVEKTVGKDGKTRKQPAKKKRRTDLPKAAVQNGKVRDPARFIDEHCVDHIRVIIETGLEALTDERDRHALLEKIIAMVAQIAREYRVVVDAPAVTTNKQVEAISEGVADALRELEGGS